MSFFHMWDIWFCDFWGSDPNFGQCLRLIAGQPGKPQSLEFFYTAAHECLPQVVFVANGMATEQVWLVFAQTSLYVLPVVFGWRTSLQALQTLGMSLAARSLVRLEEGTELPKQDLQKFVKLWLLQFKTSMFFSFVDALRYGAKELVFVVNKNTLRYEGSALEKILEQKFDDAGRQDPTFESTNMALQHFHSFPSFPKPQWLWV